MSEWGGEGRGDHAPHEEIDESKSLLRFKFVDRVDVHTRTRRNEQYDEPHGVASSPVPSLQ